MVKFLRKKKEDFCSNERISVCLDLHLLICLFPVGAWFCIKELNDERVFIVLYAVFASYFAGVMIRLMLTLTPCVCVLGKN